MDALWELCNTDDFGALVCLTVLANFVGHRMAGDNAKACRLSLRFAGGTFLLYCCIRIMPEGATEPLVLCAIAIRGIVAGVFIAGLTLIVMAPLLLLDAQLMAGWGAVKQRVTAWTGAWRAGHLGPMRRRRRPLVANAARVCGRLRRRSCTRAACATRGRTH